VTAQRGRGRPAIGDRMECRFPIAQRGRIDELAEQWGVRPPEVVRRLVDAGLEALDRADADAQ